MLKSKNEMKKKFLQKNFYKNIKQKFLFVFFLGGFIIDIFTLTKVDAFVGNVILFGYLSIALISIFLLNWGDYRDIKNIFLFWVYRCCPYIMQFCFGALFSGFVVYYTISGTFIASWPFLLLLYIFFIANEKIQKFYEKFEFQISVFFASFLALSIYFIPVVSHKVGDEIFIASGFIALFFTYWIMRWIFRCIPILKKKKKKIIFSLLFIFSIFNGAYFFQLIPPVPLSLKNIEVAHLVEKKKHKGKHIYQIKQDIKVDENFFEKLENIFWRREGEKIFIYTSVYAPKNLKTDIVHHWKFFNTLQQKWVTVQKIKYPIVGGRSGGYRGYSFVSKAQDGKWRVDIENTSGFLIGRKDFEVKNVSKNLVFSTKIFE